MLERLVLSSIVLLVWTAHTFFSSDWRGQGACVGSKLSVNLLVYHNTLYRDPSFSCSKPSAGYTIALLCSFTRAQVTFLGYLIHQSLSHINHLTAFEIQLHAPVWGICTSICIKIAIGPVSFKRCWPCTVVQMQLCQPLYQCYSTPISNVQE